MQAAEASTTSTGGFAKRLEDYRQSVLPLLADVVPDKEPGRYLYGLIGDYLARPGKGLRPALCLATCGAFRGDLSRALPTAAAFEMLHNAFLVHDDIEDESELRRDLPALHVITGVPLAINVGDAMNALTFRLLARNVSVLGPELSGRVFGEFDHLLMQSLEGQAMELGWIRDNVVDVGDRDYLRMVLKKTCWYSFMSPCRTGALVAGAADNDSGHDLSQFDKFGFLLGAAFQTQDDVLNLIGNARYGKEIGGDLYEGKRTLALAHLLRSAADGDRRRLQDILGRPRGRRLPREIHWMHDLMDRHGSIRHAQVASGHLCRAAATAFEEAYGTADDNEHKAFIRALVAFVVERDR
jgi:geranylgeranyl diphosphate synthase type II